MECNERTLGAWSNDGLQYLLIVENEYGAL
jgi:hypothetical protein